MAAVTQNVTPTYNVAGSMRDQHYNVTGVDTNTLQVGLRTVKTVNIELSTITAYTLTANALGTLITFSASGAFTGVDVQVMGY